MTSIDKNNCSTLGLLHSIDMLRNYCTTAKFLRLWLGLASGAYDFSQPQEIIKSINPKLVLLTVDSTGICDLHCQGMCYYHPDIDSRKKSVSDDAIIAAIQVAYEKLGLRTLIFAGKEPLLDITRLVRLATLINNLLVSKELSVGIITNGRLIEKHWIDINRLAQNGSLDFLDISIDSGITEQHDVIRGKPGTFMRAFTALERCIKEWPKVRVGTASVLRSDNASGILQLISRSAAFNRYFCIAPIQPPPFTTTPPLYWHEIRAFLHSLLAQLTIEHENADLEIIIQLPGLYLWDAEADGFFEWHELQEDALGQIFTERNIAGNRVVFVLQVLPETGWRTARITYDGAYLPNAHFLQDPHPEKFAVGYIQEEPLTDLYQRAISDDSIFSKMLKSRIGHSCRERPCWGNCFGGLAGSENSFMGGADIHQQPRMCLKTDSDFLTPNPN